MLFAATSTTTTEHLHSINCYSWSPWGVCEGQLNSVQQCRIRGIHEEEWDTYVTSNHLCIILPVMIQLREQSSASRRAWRSSLMIGDNNLQDSISESPYTTLYHRNATGCTPTREDFKARPAKAQALHYSAETKKNHNICAKLLLEIWCLFPAGKKWLTGTEVMDPFVIPHLLIRQKSSPPSCWPHPFLSYWLRIGKWHWFPNPLTLVLVTVSTPLTAMEAPPEGVLPTASAMVYNLAQRCGISLDFEPVWRSME